MIGVIDEMQHLLKPSQIGSICHWLGQILVTMMVVLSPLEKERLTKAYFRISASIQLLASILVFDPLGKGKLSLSRVLHKTACQAWQAAWEMYSYASCGLVAFAKRWVTFAGNSGFVYDLCLVALSVDAVRGLPNHPTDSVHRLDGPVIVCALRDGCWR